MNTSTKNSLIDWIMNLLFCNTSNVSVIKGGTERITARISQGMEKLGNSCFLAYKEEIPTDFPLVKFTETINVNCNSLEDFIIDNKIDIVIIQKMTRDVKMFFDIRKRNKLNFKIISVLHFNPGYEEISTTFHSFCSQLKRDNSLKEYVKDIIRIMIYPLYKTFYPFRNKDLYKKVYRYSDKVVLLSSSFIRQYEHYAGLKESSKLLVIPNALSYDDFLCADQIFKKKKEVLLVSRLEENQKRISLAIRIWAELEKDETLNDWTFKIVGDGPDRIKYEALVSKLNLQRVIFCGRQDPQRYYKQNRLFFMTSAFEGWGLTLTEAQQYGCVPIAFDTYSSLHDIINSGINGYIIGNDNIQSFVQKVKGLMTDEQLFYRLSSNAIESSQKFKLNNICCSWVNLIEEK